MKKRLIALFLVFLFAFAPARAAAQNKLNEAMRRDLVEAILYMFAAYSKDSIDLDKCFFAMLKRGVGACDKYAEIWIGDEEQRELAYSLSGIYYGIGATILPKDNLLILVPFVDSPADSAGLLPGDILLRVDSTDIEVGFTPSDAAKLIRGQQEGTIVNITIARNKKVIGPIAVRRGKISIPSLVYDTVTAKIGYVKIYQFYPGFSNALGRALDSLSGMGARGFVIDVRNNPGGVFDEILSALDKYFSPAPGRLIAEQRNQRGVLKVYQTSGIGIYKDSPVVVLANRFSASAAEVTAAVLKEWGIAEVVGDTTFGKGSVQALFDSLGPLVPRLGMPFSMKLTTAEYFIGDRRVKVDGVGVPPDYVVRDSVIAGPLPLVPLNKARFNLLADPPLQKAVEILKRKM